MYWRGVSEIAQVCPASPRALAHARPVLTRRVQHTADCTRRHNTAVNLLTAEFQSHKTGPRVLFLLASHARVLACKRARSRRRRLAPTSLTRRPAPFPEWELRTREHEAMKRECEIIAMGAKSMKEDDSGGLSTLHDDRPQTVLHARGHICPRCDDRGGAQDSDTQLMYEYQQLREKHHRLEAKYQTLQARELRLVDRLPKIAQYELAALPHPWTAHLHPLGRTFYFNHESGVSSWHDPRLVPSPKVEGCPQFNSRATREGQNEYVPNSEELNEDNVGPELWGDQAVFKGTQEAAAVPPPAPATTSRPSLAKLTGLPDVKEKRVLSESELHLPWHSYAPAEEDVRPSARQSGIAVDSPKGSHMRGKLQVSGPILVPRRSTKKGKGKGREDEEERQAFKGDRAFDGELRTVALDGDRLWLSTADSPVFPWEQAAGTAQDGKTDAESGSNMAGLLLDLNMDSIPLWKARLEIIYPERDQDVSNLLWGEGGLGALLLDSNASTKISEMASRYGSDAELPTSDRNARPHVFEQSFTRWRVLDRLSRYWLFQSRSKHEARDWVMSLTHNMLLVDSGRIRPSNFHILAPQTDDTRSLSSAGNVSAEARLYQVQEELLQTTHMLQHTRHQLRDCLKTQRSRSQRKGAKDNTESGIGASVFQKAQSASSRMEADQHLQSEAASFDLLQLQHGASATGMPPEEREFGTGGVGHLGGSGEAFGRILNDLESPKAYAYVRQVLRLRDSDAQNLAEEAIDDVERFAPSSEGTSEHLARACGADGLQPCPTTQSTTSEGGASSRAVDANTHNHWGGSSCTHTAECVLICVLTCVAEH